MVTTVLTTAQWNALLDKVNNATKSCGGGGLAHVTDPHLWSLQDITAVQNALKAGCSTATFTTPAGPPYIWMQKIIDEINTALSVACCNGSTGPTGPTGATGSGAVFWYVILCDCNGALHADGDYTWCGGGCIGSFVFVGSIVGWSTTQYPNAQALATAWAASANANETYLGQQIYPFQVHSVPAGTSPVASGPCTCS